MFDTSVFQLSLVASSEKNISDSSESKLSVALLVKIFRFSSSFSMSTRMLDDFDFFSLDGGGDDRGVVEWNGNLRFPKLTPLIKRVHDCLTGAGDSSDGIKDLCSISMVIGAGISSSASSSSDDWKSSSSIISSCDISVGAGSGIAGVSSIIMS